MLMIQKVNAGGYLKVAGEISYSKKTVKRG
jgi:hypothetical protein